MERVSRQIVIVSIVLAGAAHAWLAHPPIVAITTLVVFAAMLALSRYHFRTALGVVAFSAYIAPALLSALYGRYDYHQLGVWLAAVSGVLIAQADRSRWHVPAAWRFPVIAWALVVALSWPVVAAREVDFSLIAASTYGVANSVAQQSPPLASAFTILMALTQLVTLLWIDVVFAAFGRDVRGSAQAVGIPFVLGVSLSALTGIYQRMIDVDFLNLPIWSNLIRAGGLMNDANTLGIGTATWATLSIAVGWMCRLGWASLAPYALLGAGMWTAGSRTALLAFAAGSVGVVIGVLQRRGMWQPRMGRIAALLGAAVLILLVALLPRNFDAGNPLMRALDRVPRLEADEIRRFVVEDLWIRFGYGQAAVDIIRDHPLTGIGVGAFHLIAPEYLYRTTGRILASDNAQNWWRHQIAELGLLGALAPVWLSVLLLGMLRGEARGEPEGAVPILRAAIVGIGLASLLGVPTQHPATSLTLATAAFWLSGLIGLTPAESHGRTPVVAALVLAFTVSAGLVLTARGDLRPLTRALETGVPHVQGLSPLEGLSDYGDFRWSGTESIAAVPVMNRWMQLTLWAPYADVARRNITAAVAIDEREVLRHGFTSTDGMTHYIAMPANTRAVTMSIDVTGAVPPRRAIQVAITWRGEAPPGVPAERIIR